jgi:site-specific recombinase XerD
LEKLRVQDGNQPPDYYAALQLFLKSRREGISPNTLRDYKITLSKALNILGLNPTTKAVNRFLTALPCSLGGKYGYFKDIRAFYNWLYSPRSGLGFRPEDNPILWVEAPKRPQLILPSLSSEEIMKLIGFCLNVRTSSFKISTGGIASYVFWARVEKKPMHLLVSYQSDT